MVNPEPVEGLMFAFCIHIKWLIHNTIPLLLIISVLSISFASLLPPEAGIFLLQIFVTYQLLLFCKTRFIIINFCAILLIALLPHVYAYKTLGI